MRDRGCAPANGCDDRVAQATPLLQSLLGPLVEVPIGEGDQRGVDRGIDPHHRSRTAEVTVGVLRVGDTRPMRRFVSPNLGPETPRVRRERAETGNHTAEFGELDRGDQRCRVGGDQRGTHHFENETNEVVDGAPHPERGGRRRRAVGHAQRFEDRFSHVVGERDSRSFGDVSSRAFDAGVRVHTTLTHPDDGVRGVEAVAGGMSQAVSQCRARWSDGVVQGDRAFLHGDQTRPGRDHLGDAGQAKAVRRVPVRDDRRSVNTSGGRVRHRPRVDDREDLVRTIVGGHRIRRSRTNESVRPPRTPGPILGGRSIAGRTLSGSDHRGRRRSDRRLRRGTR